MKSRWVNFNIIKDGEVVRNITTTVNNDVPYDYYLSNIIKPLVGMISFTDVSSYGTNGSAVNRAVIYTDGACDNIKSKCGGFGVCCVIGNVVVKLSGHVDKTTNNIMELFAITLSLMIVSLIPSIVSTIIHSDSTYCVKGLNEWYLGWKRRNFKSVKNVELWKYTYEQFHQLIIDRGSSITYKYVKAHVSDSEATKQQRCNNIVDKLANDAMNNHHGLLI